MKKSQYSAAAWEREKAAARRRAGARYAAMKGNPEYVANERRRIGEIIKRKRDLLVRIRRERGCIECGLRDGVLDFDHRPGEQKLFSPTHGTHYSMEKMMAEIAKCDVRCRPCHARRHGVERGGLNFGTTLPPGAFVNTAHAEAADA